MGNNQRLGWVGVVVCSLAAAGCVELDGDERSDEAPSVELDEVGAVTSAVDAMRERARRAFVARDGVLRGGDATAGAEVSERGVALTPYRWRDDTTDEPGATLVLETVSITRGGHRLAAAIAAPPVLTRAGAAELDRGAAVEVVRTIDRGIEQSWRFDDEPAALDADADLVVRVAVTGQSHAGHTATGHHFVDPATGLGFAYGDATWVDATGARSAVPVAYTGGELVLTVPAAVVRRSAYPAVLDPVVSSEFGLDTPIVGPAVGGQFTPDVAFSGTEYLVVWADHRRENTFTSDVFAARVTLAGGVLDPAGIHVPTTNISGHQLDPAVAFGGNQWFIVYAETTTPQIRGMRLTLDGTPLSPDFDVTSRDFATIESQPDIAFNPGFLFGIAPRFMVTWRLTNGGIQVQMHSVSTSTGAGAMATLTVEPSAQRPAIAAGGPAGGFVVTWDDHATGNTNVMARQVNSNATALGPLHAVTTESSGQTNPAIAFAPDVGYLVVWEDNRTGTVDLWGHVLTIGGAPQPGGNLQLISASNTQSAPALAVGGGTSGRMMLLTWTDTRNDSAGDIFGARMEPLGGSLISIFDPGGFAISAATGAQQTSAVAFNGASQFLAVWRDERTTSPNIVGTRVAAATGGVFEPNGIVLGRSFNQQTAPAIASCGGKYLAVWSDTRNGDVAPDIYGALTDSSTPPVVLAANIAISTAAGRQDVPAVACNGTDFFVVWADERTIGASNRDIYGARVRASDGAVLDPAGVVVSTAFGSQTDPAITYVAAANAYGVAWADGRSGDYDVYLKEVSAAGVVDHASEINVSGTVIGDQWWPDLTGDAPFAGASPRFFVVWQDGRGTWSGWDVYGRFLGLDGTLDPTIAISTTFGAQTAPTVATKVEASPSDARWHVVAYDSASPLVTPGIYANVVSPAGAVGAPAALAATTADTEGAPDLAVRDGAAMVLACHRTTGSDTFDLDVLGVDVTSTSTTVAAVGATFVISDVPPSNVAHAVRERLPAVACGTTLSCQALYQRYADAAYTGDPPVDAGGVDRIRARVLTY
jgi:hypothetical protein